jgi:hypothetical protein
VVVHHQSRGFPYLHEELRHACPSPRRPATSLPERGAAGKAVDDVLRPRGFARGPAAPRIAVTA